MTEEFLMNLEDIQPSQLYINSQKLENVLKWFNPKDYTSYDALPVKNLFGKVIFTDGHTRAYASYQAGVKTIKVYWDEDELDWDLYQTCVHWCNLEGVNSIKDLEKKIIGPEEYKTLWIDRCKMEG